MKSQLNLAHGTTKTGKVWKNSKTKTGCSEETVGIIVRGGSPEGRSETTHYGRKFVKRVRLKMGVKE